MRKPSLPSISLPQLPQLDQRIIPLPQAIFYLTCASLLASFILLLVSMLDLGVFSLWINPPLSLFTIVYHASVLVLSQRKRKAEEPSYFSTVTICAYILAIVWFVAFIVTVVVLASYKGDYRVESLQHRGLPVSVETQRLQIFLTLFEFIVVGGIGMKGHMIARSEGDPASWRPEEDYDNDKPPAHTPTTSFVNS